MQKLKLPKSQMVLMRSQSRAEVVGGTKDLSVSLNQWIGKWADQEGHPELQTMMELVSRDETKIVQMLNLSLKMKFQTKKVSDSVLKRPRERETEKRTKEAVAHQDSPEETGTDNQGTTQALED